METIKKTDGEYVRFDVSIEMKSRSIQVLYDTANAVFVILDKEDESKGASQGE